MNKKEWTPTETQIQNSHIHKFIIFINQQLTNAIPLNNSDDLYDWSIRFPQKFWALFWQYSGIQADKLWDTVLENGEDMLNARWFVGARFNYARNLLKYQDKSPAIIFWNEGGQQCVISFELLYQQVAKIAAHLRNIGVVRSDIVAGIVANTPHAVIAMLATTSIGAIWSSCSPDFGTQGIIDRIGQINPKILFAVDGYHYGDKPFDCINKVNAISAKLTTLTEMILIQYADSKVQLNVRQKHMWWDDILKTSKATSIDFEAVAFDHPAFILYSSGTTGIPKCIVHSGGGTLIQHLKEHMLHTDLNKGDRMFFYTTCGWMMWNWLVSALATGVTLVLYDGSPVHGGPQNLWNLAQETKVKIFGTSAKYLSILEKTGFKPRERFKLENLHAILSTGSPLLPKNYDYVYQQIKRDLRLCSISGGTDIISCFALGNPTKPIYRGELQQRGFGMAVTVLNDEGKPTAINEKGELSCTKPFPSQPIYFWNDPNKERYKKSYFDKFPNIWCHGDFAAITEHDGLVIYGRSDTTLKAGGIRIGTAEIYRQIEDIEEIVGAVAVDQEFDGDARIILFIKLHDNAVLTQELVKLIKTKILTGASPHHVPAKIIAVADIPHTLNGKDSETAVKDIINHRVVNNKESLANPESLALFTNLPELSK